MVCFFSYICYIWLQLLILGTIFQCYTDYMQLYISARPDEQYQIIKSNVVLFNSNKPEVLLHQMEAF